MARQVDGVSSILRAGRVICRMVGRFGVVPLAARTSPELAAAAQALATACLAFEALDDYPGEHDETGPIIPGEDHTGGI